MQARQASALVSQILVIVFEGGHMCVPYLDGCTNVDAGEVDAADMESDGDEDSADVDDADEDGTDEDGDGADNSLIGPGAQILTTGQCLQFWCSEASKSRQPRWQ